MKIGVVGSRTFTSDDMLTRTLARLTLQGDVIVSGGAKGADTIAKGYAYDSGLPYVEHAPDVERYGWPAAAFERNSLIVRDSDVLFAFFGPGQPPSVNKSGTMDTVRRAIAKRIPVHLYFQNE